MLSDDDIVHEMCNPHKTTALGEGINYSKFIVWTKHFLAPYMEMNFVAEEYYRDVFNEIWDYKNTVQQLPRGHSKTEMVGIWLTIYIAVYVPHNPFYRQFKGKDKKIQQQLIIAGAGDDLDAWSDRIKFFFDSNPYLAKYKPAGAKTDSTTKSWNKRKMKLVNGHQIHMRSMKSRIRGLHVDRICADDLITENGTLTDRQTIEIWDGAVDGTTTTKEAMVNVIGTPLRFTDIQFHLKNKADGYFFSKRPAIVDEGKQIVLSPKRRDYADLMRTKKRIGSTKFATEYMLNPIDDSVSLIKRVNFRSCLDKYFEGLWLKPIISRTMNDISVSFDRMNSVEFKRAHWSQIWVTVDFAFSDRRKADHTVMSIYGIKDRRAHKLGYIRNPDGEGWSPAVQFAIMAALRDYLGVTMYGLEENSIKGIVKDVKHLNLPMKLYDMMGKDSAAKKKADQEYAGRRYTIGKIPSIERLDAGYENQAFVLPYKTDLDKDMMSLQEEETISWALEDGKLTEIGRHPDIPITDILCNEMLQDSNASSGGIQMVVTGSAEDIEDDDAERVMVTKKGFVNNER